MIHYENITIKIIRKFITIDERLSKSNERIPVLEQELAAERERAQQLERQLKALREQLAQVLNNNN